MFRLKITIMTIFTEIYSFKLNVVWDTKCCMGHKMLYRTICHPIFMGADWVYNQNMCFLEWVFRLIRKYKLPFSFKAAIPCSINKCL